MDAIKALENIDFHENLDPISAKTRGGGILPTFLGRYVCPMTQDCDP